MTFEKPSSYEDSNKDLYQTLNNMFAKAMFKGLDYKVGNEILTFPFIGNFHRENSFSLFKTDDERIKVFCANGREVFLERELVVKINEDVNKGFNLLFEKFLE